MRFYLGFEFEAIPHWERVHPPVTAPSNYKDQAKIEAYISNKLAELQNGAAAREPLTAMLSRAVVVVRGRKSTEEAPSYYRSGDPESGEIHNDDDPQVIFDSAGAHVGGRLLEFILNKRGVIQRAEEQKNPWGNVGLFGCGIHQAMRIAALDWLADGAAGHIPLTMWWLFGKSRDFAYNELPGYIDPISLLFGTSSVPATSVAERFNLPRPDEKSAEEMALFTYALADRTLGM